MMWFGSVRQPEGNFANSKSNVPGSKFLIQTVRWRSGWGWKYLCTPRSEFTICTFLRMGSLFSQAIGTNTARIWNIENFTETQRFIGHGAKVRAAVFSSDQKYILTGSADKTARIWNVGTGKEVQNFRGH